MTGEICTTDGCNKPQMEKRTICQTCKAQYDWKRKQVEALTENICPQCKVRKRKKYKQFCQECSDSNNIRNRSATIKRHSQKLQEEDLAEYQPYIPKPRPILMTDEEQCRINLDWIKRERDSHRDDMYHQFQRMGMR